MQPAIPVDAYVLTDETAYASNKPIVRFDLVIHTAPIDEKHRKLGIDEKTRFIFRVIGLANEKIEIRKGQVLINGEKLAEPFGTFPSDDNFGPIVIPENEYFLLGDNRPESEDSRYWKPSTIEREMIIGKVVKVL